MNKDIMNLTFWCIFECFKTEIVLEYFNELILYRNKSVDHVHGLIQPHKR